MNTEFHFNIAEADAQPRDRWQGITRPYSSQDVERLRGSVRIEHTLARMGAENLWNSARLLELDSRIAILLARLDCLFASGRLEIPLFLQQR